MATVTISTAAHAALAEGPPNQAVQFDVMYEDGTTDTLPAVCDDTGAATVEWVPTQEVFTVTVLEVIASATQGGSSSGS